MDQRVCLTGWEGLRGVCMEVGMVPAAFFLWGIRVSERGAGLGCAPRAPCLLGVGTTWCLFPAWTGPGLTLALPSPPGGLLGRLPRGRV